MKHVIYMQYIWSKWEDYLCITVEHLYIFIPAAARKHTFTFFLSLLIVFFIHLKLCMFFHQLANVYCPQKILYLIHNVGWGISAQVRLHMRDNPFFSVTPSCFLCIVYVALFTANKAGGFNFFASLPVTFWQEEILSASPADSIYNDPRGVYSREVSSATSRCPCF